MSRNSTSHILTLSNTQAKDLAGMFVAIGEETYYFKNYDRASPGQPPWRSGAEGKAYPLLRHDRSAGAYLKFFTRPTQKRLDRTAWLIGQQIHAWLPGLAAAPLLWTDTRLARHAPQIGFEFAGYLARAVPGETWQELKNRITGEAAVVGEDLRWRCIKDLILALAVLEQAEILHGDMSPNNIVINLDAPPDRPALYVIDFDAFVTPAAGANRVVTVGEGGTYGTEGYCPPDLAAAAAEGEGSAAPYSDRYGRDMLLVELLFMDRAVSPDSPPANWDREQFERRYAAWRARSDSSRSQILAHLTPTSVFALAEQDRPSSAELAAGLGLSGVHRRALSRAPRVCLSAPAVLGHRMPAGIAEPYDRSPASGNTMGQGRSRGTMARHIGSLHDRPEPDYSNPSIWEDLAPLLPTIAGLLALLLALAVMALLRLAK